MAHEASDEKRFTAIYDSYRQNVWAFAAGRAGRQIADEVVSETFTVAWRRLGDIPDPALPWLLGVARNVLRDNHRAEVRRDSLAADLRRWAPKPTGDIAEDVAERLGVLRAMGDLPDADREILILVAWQGLSPREAARVVGCSAAALRVRLHRARRRLVRRSRRRPRPPPARRRVRRLRSSLRRGHERRPEDPA
ncbi:RNA polymerase sigma factor [Actinomadura roseirufa]|uniref:RNA polymerase sigma factor n=1 Tax=Actinomadura roseirufa TaxID=2094049 RepID=UPI001F5EEC0C|nr:sigma-70 family RNA polymerase sigma factor [Actinomadura roseirufa]